MSSRMKYLFAGGAVVVVALFAAWWFILRDDAPEEVSLAGALEATTTSTTAAPPSSGETTTTSATGATDAGLDGIWTVDTSKETFVGYRVEEELARIGFTTAVGRTPAVTGGFEFTDMAITSADFEADLTQLQSDSNSRDNQIRRQALETNDFPTAGFVLAEPIQLGAGPQAGVAFTAEAVGDLTIHGVTNRVTIPLDGQLIDSTSAVVVGSIPIVFADYDIDPPSAVVVLSVEDNGVMEFQLFFSRES